ncbi:hypothetical protein Drose_32605 [Dactylosporangium roseum]|uniref:Uncharacterized protein n=1 Tax=Dactylosporangium roseum TaxID=47989 RepID=A0ABY5Z4L1_9ACTN|nr:hypothetical protein [Dactylosporangium roseum]UWZ35787.1 hypothetical protein Drose_32605 [Dactylosporangium roseum]
MPPGLLRLGWAEWRHGFPLGTADLLDFRLPDAGREAARGDGVSGKVA